MNASTDKELDPYDLLRRYLAQFAWLTPDDIEAFVHPFQTALVKKRQYIVQPGFTARNRHFVVQGAFRSFVVGDSGSDHTISFAIENWWITDYNSYIFQRTATSFVAALEDSRILQIRTGQASFDPKLDALARLTREIVERRGRASEATKEAFFAAGYTEAHLVETAIIIGDKMISNFLHNLTGFEIDFPLAEEI